MLVVCIRVGITRIPHEKPVFCARKLNVTMEVATVTDISLNIVPSGVIQDCTPVARNGNDETSIYNLPFTGIGFPE
jgi:hypothetical protein